MRMPEWITASLRVVGALIRPLFLMLILAHPALGQRPFPDSADRILIFTDQLPTQLSTEQLKFVASHYVGTQKMPPSWTVKVRAINPNFIVLHYQLALGNGPADFLAGEKWVNDFDRVQQHPDWFFHGENGAPLLQPAWNWYVMDIRFDHGRPVTGYPQDWVETAVSRMRENQCDGVFADSYTQDILMNQTQPKSEPFASAAACTRDWLPNLNAFGDYCATALHQQPEKFYYLPNLGGLVTTWDRTTNFAVGDGGMNEGFAAPGPGQYYSEADWKQAMTTLLQLASQGKIALCQTSIAADNMDDRSFVVGSFLLVKGHRSYLNMMAKSSLEWYPEYDIPLGKFSDEPAADVAHYYFAPWKCYRRLFEHGMVLVNPTGGKVALTLDQPYRLAVPHGGGPVSDSAKTTGTLTYESITQVELSAHDACVLLSP